MANNRSVTVWGPWLCVGLLLLHWTCQLLGVYGLMFDESQYWFWGKTPSLGYYSKPPMIGWLIAISTTLFGNGVFGTKMLSPLLHLGIAFILYQTAIYQGEDRKTAWWVVVTYITMPFVVGAGAFFATDTPLMFFWAASLYSLLRALKEEKPQWWLLAGVTAGLGLQSKYTMGVFALSAFLLIISKKEYRTSLTTIWPWLAGIVAAIVFAPNIWWNSQHQFATISHTENNMLSKSVEIYPVDMLAFLGSQFGVFGPILLVVLLVSLFKLKTTDENRPFKLFVWPLFIIGLIVSLLAGAQAQWIAPVYVGATLLVVPWLYKQSPKLLKASFVLHLVILFIFYSAPFVMHMPENNVMARLFIWNHLTLPVREVQNQYPNATVITDERKIATALTYGLRDEKGNPHLVYKWNPTGKVTDHYDLLSASQDLSGKELLLVTRNPAPEKLDELAPDAKIVRQFDLNKKFHFYIFELPAFKGYKGQ